jgi:hypothetical protein
MSERPLEPERNGGSRRNGQPEAPPPEENFEELRELLLGPEQEALRKLHDPEARVKEISDALPAAFAKRGTNDPRLTRALRPSVEEAVTQSIRRQPQFFADLLAPVLAPTIRRAIAQAFESTLQTIRMMTSRTFSIQGLKWRLEAWRTGLSIGEIAMRKTLRYRVEQVFLIHRETGVLLEYVAIRGAPGADSDMVSGMLTAIGQFVSDSFHTDAAQSLDAIKVGEFRVWVERGPRAVLAATIRGTPPTEFRTVMQDTLDGIQVLHQSALENFKGETNAFRSCRPDLEACLRSETSDPAPAKVNLRSVLWRTATVLLLLAGLWIWRWWIDRSKRAELVRLLDHEPGLMTTTADIHSKVIRLRGLRDPLARDPNVIAREAGFPEGTIDAYWEPFHSLDPALIGRRAEAALMVPDGIKLTLEGGTLKVQGSATHAWIEGMRRNALAVPGIGKLDDSQLIDLDLVRWQDCANEVEKIIIRFEGAGEGMGPPQREELARVAEIARAASDSSAKLGRQTQIEATGEMFRASVVAAALGSLNAPPCIIRVAPPKSDSPNAVSLRLQLLDGAPQR